MQCVSVTVLVLYCACVTCSGVGALYSTLVSRIAVGASCMLSVFTVTAIAQFTQDTHFCAEVFFAWCSFSLFFAAMTKCLVNHLQSD